MSNDLTLSLIHFLTFLEILLHLHADRDDLVAEGRLDRGRAFLHGVNVALGVYRGDGAVGACPLGVCGNVRLFAGVVEGGQ